MERHTRAGVIAVLTAIFLGSATADPSIPVAYCASINTAETSANSSIYQSEGLCYDFCNDLSYALGILQEKDCWCSNYVPDSDDQVDTSECETSCPGYPDDYCGGDDLYGYITLSASPSGTTGGATTATSTSKSATPVTATEIQTKTETETETQQDSVTTSPTSTATPSSTSSITLTSDKSSKATTTSTPESTTKTTEIAKTTGQKNNGGSPTTITSVQTVTSEGSIIIQTITTISTPSANSSGSSGLTKGATAGLVVGILAAIVAFVIGAILFRRHKQRMQSEQAVAAGGVMGDRRGSSAGIMSKAGTVSSGGFGMAMEEDGVYGTAGRRVSMKPMDPRLDPKVGLYRIASHDSLNTIRDDQDYSRRVHEAPRIMRVTNPDPEADD